MPKIKIARKSTFVDMTAMCDVAFLLLAFFILTAKFRPSELVQVQTPSSRAEHAVKDDLVTFTIDDAGKVYMNISKVEKRKQIIDKLFELEAQKYSNVPMTEEKKQAFQNLELVGVPIQNLPQVVAMDKDEILNLKASGKLSGIPVDSVNNQLKDWIMAVRHVYVEYDNKEKAPIAIKGDKKANMKDVTDLIDIFRKNDVYSFNLITTLEVN
jgi:biopolymer transport protein ExbD